MKINIENYLHQIDEMFKDKSQKDIYMIYIMLFSIIFAFSYLLFWESSENSFKEINIKIDDIKNEINTDEIYLKYNTENKVLKLNQEIKDTESKMVEYRDNNEYIKNKIETISSLIYDERAWGEYLHSISINAQKYNMKIINFTNKYALNKNAFGHILDIEIKTIGNYKNTLNFINSLEQSELVVDIHSFNVKTEEHLNTDLNISVWGITY